MTQGEHDFFDEWAHTVVPGFCDKPDSYYRVCYGLDADPCRERFFAAFTQCGEHKLAAARRFFNHDRNFDAGILALDCTNAALDVELATRLVSSNVCTERRRKLLRAAP